MTTKNITIDLDAYGRLNAVKGPNESFSQVIERVVSAPVDPQDWFRAIDEQPLSKRAARAIEGQLERRAIPSAPQR